MPKKDPTLLLRAFFCTLARRVVDVVSIRKMDDSAKSVREAVHLMRKPLIINGFLRREGERNEPLLFRCITGIWQILSSGSVAIM